MTETINLLNRNKVDEKELVVFPFSQELIQFVSCVPWKVIGIWWQVKYIDIKAENLYCAVMTENTENNTTKTAGNKAKILAGFLTSAIDMEDEISNSIYKDYMDAKNWPKNIKPEIFQNIRQYLNVLIADTRKHREIILGLMQKYGRDN